MTQYSDISIHISMLKGVSLVKPQSCLRCLPTFDGALAITTMDSILKDNYDVIKLSLDVGMVIFYSGQVLGLCDNQNLFSFLGFSYFPSHVSTTHISDNDVFLWKI